MISNAEEITDSADIAHAFSEHFATTENEQTPPSGPIVSRCAHSFYLRPTCADEVLQVIMALKTTGAGLDGIHASKVRLVAKELSPILADITNKMFTTGVFPQILKIGKIIPVFKKGDRECISNYRPFAFCHFSAKS